MSFTVDPAHPWRTIAFARIPVSHVSFKFSPAQLAEAELVEEEDSAMGVRAWLEHEEPYMLPDDVARAAYNGEQLQAQSEMTDLGHPQGLASAAKVGTTLPYDYNSKVTGCRTRTDGRHMQVRAAVNEAVIDRMNSAMSVDAMAKDVGLKLPRLVQNAQSKPGDVTYNQLEALRYDILQAARQDDYALRLFNAARVVAHSCVLHQQRKKPAKTEAMGRPARYRSLLTAELPNITTQELQEDSWWYVGDDLSEDYRAFLAMAARGLQHFTSAQTDTVYSNCVTEAEVIEQQITFVRKNGTVPSPQPGGGAFLKVLSSPDLAAAYYYTYAASLGIGHSATQILAHACIGPHLWASEAILPYRCEAPKLDAGIYLVRETAVVDQLQLADVQALVNHSAVFARKALAGLGAVITSYRNSKKTDVQQTMQRMVGVLAAPEQSRSLLRRVHSCLNPGYLGLEWLDPFRPSVERGWERCVEAYRLAHTLLSQFHRPPTRTLKSLFTTGVAMSGVVPGSKAEVASYAELVVYQVLAGEAISCESELVRNDFVDDFEPLAMYSHWHALLRFVRYHTKPVAVPKPGSGTPPKPLVPVPQSPQLSSLHRVPQTRSEDGFSRPHTRSTSGTTATSDGANTITRTVGPPVNVESGKSSPDGKSSSSGRVTVAGGAI
ncbi:hypothetical protein [Colletotrichum fructicola chrysovirus 1]|uniref:Uncharacterized protein n=1 Tax=Colletotrichum fructicola chrysovirus 1 TaxID=2304034 RepID=A0A346IME2_9VIRU|nr:hypothetical protein [Colletotrichum fructicola chrysovirus 1]AXP19677.1 hypothetical protein [Colletotrichum fructicola chrysovirus 1]